MHASHDLAPGGRGLATLFHGSPSVGELREDHQEFWILLFQLQQWKRTFLIQQLLLGCLRPGASLCSEHSTLLLPVLQTLLKCHLPPESLACSAQVRDEPPTHTCSMGCSTWRPTATQASPTRSVAILARLSRETAHTGRAVVTSLGQGLATSGTG